MGIFKLSVNSAVWMTVKLEPDQIFSMCLQAENVRFTYNILTNMKVRTSLASNISLITNRFIKKHGIFK